MLAARLAAILPPLGPAELLEVSMIHSIAGQLSGGRLSDRRPFRTPHHSATMAALVGGGSKARPGEVSLAHNGVLFLDELPEYSAQALDEGWSIFDAEFQLDERPGLNHDGEPCMVTLIGHELQVQRYAWVLVMNGTSDCHDLARRIIAAESPVEFSRMLNYTKGWDL